MPPFKVNQHPDVYSNIAIAFISMALAPKLDPLDIPMLSEHFQTSIYNIDLSCCLHTSTFIPHAENLGMMKLAGETKCVSQWSGERKKSVTRTLTPL